MATAPQMADVSLGARMRFARLAVNVSVTEAARRCDVSRDSWTDYERDRRSVPSDVLTKFADEFNVSADWLLFGATRPKLNGRVPKTRDLKVVVNKPIGDRSRPHQRELPYALQGVENRKT